MTLNAAHFKLYLIRDFLDAQACGEIIEELSHAQIDAATVYGRGDDAVIDQRTRKADRLKPSARVVEHIMRQLSERQIELGDHYGVSLTNCEEPQFLRYGVGDFFVAHQDGNTGMMRSEREQRRKISIVIFLNGQSENPHHGCYGGGNLVFSEWRVGHETGRFRLFADAGTLVAFPAETTHEVVPVTHGERYSIASWYG